MLNEFTVLYVEDDLDMQEYMSKLLMDEIKEFYQAYDGEEGFLLYKQKKPDIIICDINMPILNGIDMSKKIKALDYDQIIIFLSSINDISLMKESIDINIDGYINKPILDVNVFLKTIHSKVAILKYKRLKKKEAKTELLLNVIREVSHHWRQPLSVISIIASEYSYKYENKIAISNEDVEKFHLITTTVQNLSEILDKIEYITLEGKDIDDLNKIIQISNPIYKN